MAYCVRSEQYRRQIEGSDGMRAALGGTSAPNRSSSRVRAGTNADGGSKPIAGSTTSLGIKPAAPVRISQQRFDSIKVTDAFSSSVGIDSGLPCHVQHGSSRNDIKWDIPPEEIQAQAWPLLITAAAGLQQRTHPHAIKSRNGFADLCSFITTLDAAALRQVTSHIRAALIVGLSKADKTFDVFFAALDALVRLSDALQTDLNPYLGALLAPIAKAAASRNRTVKEKVELSLNDVVRNGGEEAGRIIKSKIPCF
eukprot:GEMP01044878.1.p1 GENE.GEMP01044878.1~~GEMP01044878.1.p1  ORF type:complete len:254 (+),score=46.00 GEMP01044878.1:81-842(+)